MTEDASRIRQLRHDLRTPINHIVGYAELLIEDATDSRDDAMAKALETIRADATSVLALIEQIPDGASTSEQGAAIHAIAQGILARLDPLVASAGAERAADLAKVTGAATTLLALTAQAEVPEPATSVPESNVRPGHLLVVDDNEMNRDMLERRLVRLGYTVECAENGRQALDRLAEGNIDLVLLDVMMPEMDGIAVLEQRRTDPRLREIPVIMLSAVSEIESIARCIELGAEDYLPKPFNSVLLRARIGACLERKRGRDAELAYLDDVARLTEASTALEAGHFDSTSLDRIAARSDALGNLARVFQRMAIGVAEREATLQARVQQLQYVFLSYASHDRDLALGIVEQLEAAGIRVWVDRQGIAGGTNYGLEIVHGIRDCAVMIIACSDASMASRNVKQEIQIGWKYGRPYVPLLLEPVTIPDEVEYWLEGWQWVEVLQHASVRWLPDLLAALNHHGVQPVAREAIDL